MDFSLDEIRPTYRFNETCQEAMRDYNGISGILGIQERDSRNAISLGGDSDTLAAITGGIAEAYYGIPVDIRESALSYLDRCLLNILRTFESVYGTNAEMKKHQLSQGKHGGARPAQLKKWAIPQTHLY